MELTEKHAELVGLHYGDGSLIRRKETNKLRFQLRGDAITDKAHYDTFIIPLCNELIGFPLLGRKVRTVRDRKRNCFGVSIESPQMNDFFRVLGVQVGRKEELSIPDWIKENQEFSKAFVRGLFDTDGCIYYRVNNTAKTYLNKVGFIEISSTSKNLIEDSSILLSILNIKNYVRLYKKTNGEKDCYKLNVHRPHVKEFMEIIGSNNPKHLTKYWIWKKFGFCPPRTTPQQREQILKGELNPLSLYARVP